MPQADCLLSSVPSLLQVKDVMAHLYFKAKESFAQQAPKEVGGQVVCLLFLACGALLGGRTATESRCDACGHPTGCTWLGARAGATCLLRRHQRAAALSTASCCTAYWQVRILKYLLTVESEADRVQLLEQAFEPGAPRGFSRNAVANW